ncbi:MAG: hypothetical protein IKC74_03185 [Clostridia bacterium]|nr:hypothetical protein [Clostridia bacterium]
MRAKESASKVPRETQIQGANNLILKFHVETQINYSQLLKDIGFVSRETKGVIEKLRNN